MAKIGFLGLGMMGSGMASCLRSCKSKVKIGLRMACLRRIWVKAADTEKASKQSIDAGLHGATDTTACTI